MRGLTSALRLLLLVLGALPATLAAQQWQPMTFQADAPGVDSNPLRGFVPYAGQSPVGDPYPHSLEWFYLPLADVVKGPEAYDWSALESKLSGIAGRGHQAVFRFYVDYPKKPSGIPKYLLAAGLKTFPYSDAGNAESPTPSVAPDYRDRRLLDCFRKFIQAFGARYDGDPRIAYVTVGLYGFWGEWHVLRHPQPGEPKGWEIKQKEKDNILKDYTQSFHKTQLEVRYGNVTGKRKLLQNFGFEDDSFLRDTLIAKDWGFWTTLEAAHMGDSWQRHPTGGEIYPQLEQGLWDVWPNPIGEDMTRSIATIHPTWMLEALMFSAQPTPEQRENGIRALRMMGYTFFCSGFRVEQKTLTLRVENRGVAPMYYAWPAEAEALDAAGKTVGKGNALWPIPTLLPGSTTEWSIALDALPADAATILVRIPNPMPGGHPVAFANAEMGTVRDGWLTVSLKH